LLLVLVSGCATTSETDPGPGAPLGFRGISWGSPPGSGLQDRPVSQTGDVAIYQLAAGNKPRPLFGVAVAEEVYVFHSNQFYMGSAAIDGEANFKRVMAALTKNYGEPTTLVDGGGVWEVWKWRWPDSKAQVQLSFSKKYQRSKVNFVNSAIRRAATEPKAEPAKESTAVTKP
jgi:hypothetical protein